MTAMQFGYGISGSAMYCNFQTSRQNKKINIDDLIMTAWSPMQNCQKKHKMKTRFSTYLQKFVQQ